MSTFAVECTNCKKTISPLGSCTVEAECAGETLFFCDEECLMDWEERGGEDKEERR